MLTVGSTSVRTVCCFRHKKQHGVKGAVAGSKMMWFENNLHHVHHSIDIAARCKGEPFVQLITSLNNSATNYWGVGCCQHLQRLSANYMLQ